MRDIYSRQIINGGTLKVLSDNIRTVRKNKGFAQEDLANRLHVTRQTISKWEKGLSVPDAEMLSRLADELEVSVSELLDAGSIPAEQNDAIVEQLSRINEQLSIKNRRARRIWKAVIIVTIVMTIVPMILVACNMFILGTSESEGLPGGYKGTTKWIYAYDDQKYKYEIWYDDKFECGTLSIDENAGADLEKDLVESKDANEFAIILEKYYEDKGGDLIHKETKGLELKE